MTTTSVGTSIPARSRRTSILWTEAVRGSFDAAHAAIITRCGKVIGKRQIEQLVTSAAADIDAFYAAQTPLPRTAGELLVISVDGKGVVMRPEALRPATSKAAARRTSTFRTRLAAGEKPSRKRMVSFPPFAGHLDVSPVFRTRLLRDCGSGDAEGGPHVMPKPYPPEFRRKALDLVESGRSVREVAAALGIAESCLHRWRSREAKEASRRIPIEH